VHKPEDDHERNQHPEGAEKRDDGGEGDGRDAGPIARVERPAAVRTPSSPAAEMRQRIEKK